jgi:hypothetical protein
LRKGPALKKNRQNNADFSMMTEVTPRSIAYAAVQVWGVDPAMNDS